MRSVPVSEKVVGGPSASPPMPGLLEARIPQGQGSPCSSRVVTSSITSPAVSFDCRVYCSVTVTFAPARSTQIEGTCASQMIPPLA